MHMHPQTMYELAKFSVAMCVYWRDNPEHLRQAIESILGQSVRPDEIVLVVDGPIPDTIEAVVVHYDGLDFFKVVRLAENVGLGNARRIALENCMHELVAVADADDINVPDRFEAQLRCFCEDPTLSIVGGNIEEFIGTPINVVSVRNVPESNREIGNYLQT